MNTKILIDQYTSANLINLFKQKSNLIYKVSEISKCDILIDLTLQVDKLEILKKCEEEDVAGLIDTSCIDNTAILHHKSLIGCCSFHLSPTHNIEFTPGRYSNFKIEIEEHFKIKFVDYPYASTGFVFPRIFSMVINEAFLAYESGVATTTDIDRAMQFGVNYPFGPCQFSQGKEIFIAHLLNNLAKKVVNRRYQLCQHLNQYLHDEIKEQT
jgi:hypothetical protein